MSNKINEICKTILTITDEEIIEMKTVVEGQKNYTHPLKQETQRKQNALGKANELVLNSIVHTKRLLIAASPENIK